MSNNQALAQLSLTARLAIALHCVERYCLAYGLVAAAITDFLDYLWEFPTISAPDVLGEWQRNPPILVDVGLGGAFPEDFTVCLEDAGVVAEAFRTLIANTVEIVFGSFYGAADNHGSLIHLQHVLDLTEQAGCVLPPLSIFMRSQFADHHGWGNNLTAAERDSWRNLTPANP